MVKADDMPNVVAWIRRCWPVSDATLGKLLEHLTPRRFGKRECLIFEGALGGKAYFIENGITRSYWIVDGEEITTSFTCEGSIVFSMDELYYGRPSEEYVEAVESVLAYEISVEEFNRLVEAEPELAHWARVNHQNEYRRLHRTHKERLSLPAPERYRAFAKQFPEVCRRARLSDIASYIGIAPATLSRIRAELF